MSPTKHKARFTIPSDELWPNLAGAGITPAPACQDAVRKDRPRVSDRLIGLGIVAILAGCVGFAIGLCVAAVVMN